VVGYPLGLGALLLPQYQSLATSCPSQIVAAGLYPVLQRHYFASYLNFDELAPEPIQDLLGHSITYRIAIGSHRGRKVFTLQTLPLQIEDDNTNQAGSLAGFSLHAGVATRAKEREKLERICRHIARPAVSEKRLTLTSNGNVKYQLKTPTVMVQRM
jgi:hypothetical protein